MKRFLFIFITVLFLQDIKAAHVIGGEIIYEYLGPGVSANTKKYRITLKLFKETNAGANLPGTVQIGIFDNGTLFSGGFQNVNIANGSLGTPLTVNAFPACLNNPPNLQYVVGLYPFTIDLPNNINGYDISYQTCCRTNNLENVLTTTSSSTGSTFTAKIPGNSILSNSQINSSPQFRTNVSVVCYDNSFTFDFGASDPDGDSLVYEFCPAKNGGLATNSGFANPAPPPYADVPYINGYSFAVPFGNNNIINRNTGMISGVAPPFSGGTGRFVISVCAKSYRDGNLIENHQKDFLIQVNNCSLPKAELTFNNVTCDGFSQTFINAASTGGSINSYFWDFGVPSLTNDTSNLPNPTFIFPDTGIYIIKLVVNRGQTCSDSTTRPLGIYPGFIPNFNTTGVCYTSPVQFNDASTTIYGVINSWRWDFGDIGVLSDTSRKKDTVYTYPSSGPKTVQLIVTNSKGCIDTVEKNIVLIDKPIINLPFKDTLICSIDTLQLQSSFSSGTPIWTPNYRIINPNSFTPLVYPLVTTTYVITANDQGCIQKDSIKVRVVDFVTIDVMPDTAICLTDPFRIRTISDALSYIWTPSATLDNPNIKQPIATPVAASTKYVVNANIGKCQSKDSVTVITYPYPLVDAGIGGTICYGDQLQLNGTASGTVFSWSPLLGLINGNTLNPIAKPNQTTQYILSTTNSVGCKKPARDTIIVIVVPPIIAFAGYDTLVVVGQPLQLNATGSTNYLWTPSSFLNNPNIANPIAILNANQTYVVKVSDVNGCFAIDSINIVVFKTAPDIFVPTAFTPNNDGTNDKLTPVAVGLKSFDFFEVYNRWGQRVFRTTQLKTGWNGLYRGVQQTNQTFVWQVQGTDYTGKRIYKKGTAVLIQ
jgi:gliding motility-associated-like protein